MKRAKEEDLILKKAWDLLGEYKPIVPSPGFKAAFWRRLAADDGAKMARRMRPIFALPRLVRPAFVPVLATAMIVLIMTTLYIADFFSISGIKNDLTAARIHDIQMARDMDLIEDFDVIEDLGILEDFEIIDSIELS